MLEPLLLIVDARGALGDLVICVAAATCLSGCGAKDAGYAVTQRPLDVGIGATDLCFAVSSDREQSVLWWHSRDGACAERSGGPVFRVEDATFARHTEYVEVRFPMTIIEAPGRGPLQSVRQLTFRIDERTVTCVETGAAVAMDLRDTVDP